MQKITTHLWFDKEARDAAEFYTSIFEESRIKNSITLHDTPSGDAYMTSIELLGQEFMLINGGPLFRFTPAVSFLVACDAKEEVDALWSKLSEGGSPLMELGSYPFSEKYGWTQDKYGLSWQLMFTDRPIKQKITPALMFAGPVAGKAEEAINFYVSVFSERNGSASGGRKSKVGDILRYGANEAPDREGTVKHASFELEGQEFAAMDSARAHEFTFNEAISFVVHCQTQEEIDYYWDRLSSDPAAEQCGWLKDRYGFSWQIVPDAMNNMLSDKDKDRVGRVTEAFLKMKKFDIEELQKAFDGRQNYSLA